MAKWKTIAFTVLIGLMLTSSVSYAAVETQISVKFLDIRFAINGMKVKESPSAIRDEEVHYVPVRFIADILDMEMDYSAQQVDYEEVDLEQADPEIQRWVEHSLNKEMTQIREYGEHTYILITRGAKNSGGYAVEIDRVYDNGSELTVQVTFTDPPKDTPVTEEITYPFALIRLELSHETPVVFKESGGQEISTLKGLSFLPSVYKETDHLLLFAPYMDHDGSWTISGVARTFEGAILVTYYDSEGRTVEQQWLTAAASAPHWGYFSFEITDVDSDGYLTLEVFAPNEEVEREELILPFKKES